MAGTTNNAIDLSQIPLPDVIEQLSFEQIFAQMAALVKTGVAGVFAGIPTFDETIESDPAVKILQVAAYSRLLDRQRVNDAAKSVMVAYALGNDLVNLGALFGVAQLPGEDIEAFRERILLAPDAYSTAGASGAYEYIARSADAGVKDVKAISPTPGAVLVSVLAAAGDGTADAGMLANVQAALSPADKRPLCDQVTVASAEIVTYSIQADIYTYAGPDRSVVLAAAQTNVAAFATNIRRIGFDVVRSAITAQLHAAGVQKVVLNLPAADVPIDDTQASYCTGIVLNFIGEAQ
ncbi:baseplate assembly protein [Asticcacaulis solisilvae]|uniref:baseplate assembly protein n=1 Tax=Asticcacaulis solisilvae TaxID=1217274 RepID=UPI003FD8C24B